MSEGVPERRRFFRIEDIVSLNAEIIADADAAQRIEQFLGDHNRVSIRNNFNYEIEQHLGDLQHIKDRMPEVGRYLVFLQDQINLLTERLTGDGQQFDQADIPVMLSAQGMSFDSTLQASEGSYLELQIKFSPGGQEVVTIARIISCTPAESGSGHNRLALEFEHIHEADREIIVKQVHGKQINQLGAAREV